MIAIITILTLSVILNAILYKCIVMWQQDSQSTTEKLSDKHQELISKEHQGLAGHQGFMAATKNLRFTVLFLLFSSVGYAQSTVYSPNREFSFTEYLNATVITSYGDTINHPYDKLPKIDDLGHLYFQKSFGKVYLSAPWLEEATFIEYDRHGQPLQIMHIDEDVYTYHNFEENYIREGHRVNDDFINLWKKQL